MGEHPGTIILADNSVAMTGGAKALMSIVKGLHHKFDFVILTPNPGLYDECADFSEIYNIPFVEISRHPRTLLYPYYLVRNAREIHRILRARSHPVLHYNDCYNLTGIVVKMMNRNVRLIYHFRLLRDSYIKSIYPLLVRAIFRFADKVICNSRATCSGLPQSSRKIMLSDAIDVPDSLSEPLINRPFFSLLYVGNYIPGKGQDFALFCLKELRKLRQDFKVFFTGGTMGNAQNEDYKSRLLSMAEQMGLTDFVEFKGFSQTPEKEYRSADILLNFSKSESFSMVCLEAMAFGANVISLDSGGPADFVRDGETGILLEKDVSAENAARAIDRLLSRQDLRMQMRKNGFELVRSEYSISRQLESLQKIYEGE